MTQPESSRPEGVLDGAAPPGSAMPALTLADVLQPAWRVAPRVRTLVTTRNGGVSLPPYGGWRAGADQPGGLSFYFGLEDRGRGGVLSEFLQPGALNYQTRPFSVLDDRLTSGNPALFASYNVPGGAQGSLVSAPFSLEGYSAADKPTLYFNYGVSTRLDNRYCRLAQTLNSDWRVKKGTGSTV